MPRSKKPSITDVHTNFEIDVPKESFFALMAELETAMEKRRQDRAGGHGPLPQRTSIKVISYFSVRNDPLRVIVSLSEDQEAMFLDLIRSFPTHG